MLALCRVTSNVTFVHLFAKILSVVKTTESLKRISVLAHSLGGLFARYAMAMLYSSDTGKPAIILILNFNFIEIESNSKIFS